MGILKGDVEILGLGTLLQTLAMNGREGILTLYRGMDRKTIYFGPHGIRLLSTTMRRVNRLGKILQRKRKITADELKALLEEQKLVGWKLGQICINTGKINKKDLDEALHEQVAEEIFDLFMWPDAAFEFQEGPPRQKSDNPLAELTVDTNITHIVLEAARRQDELLQIRQFLNDDEMVLALAGKPRLDTFGEDRDTVTSILPLIDGRRRVREILQNSIYPRFATMRALYALVSTGIVKAQSARGAAAAKTPTPAPQKGPARG